MKVIRYENDKIKYCSIQVRDLPYLYKKFNNGKYMELYQSLLERGFTHNEFFSITDPSLLVFILNDQGILDFAPHVRCSINTLSRLVVLSTGLDKDTSEHRIGDLQDLIDLKRGMLDYDIPIIADGVTVINSEDKNFTLYSSCYPNCFVIKRNNPDIGFSYLGTFYDACINNIFESESFRHLEREVTSVIQDDCMIIRVNTSKKKKIGTRIKESILRLTKKKEA